MVQEGLAQLIDPFVFSTEFKRTTVQRILTGEKTLAELSRELDISPGVIRNWRVADHRRVVRLLESRSGRAPA